MMTNAELEAMMKETFEQLLVLRRIKSREYSEESDALSNFRRNGVDLDMPMEAVWKVYAQKHWDAVSQYVRDKTNHCDRPLSEPIENRIADLIVYLILFKAIVKEREDAERREPSRDFSLAST